MLSLSVYLAAVFGIAVILLIRIYVEKRASLVEEPEQTEFVPRAYTLQELAQYDGKTKPYAFVGVKGVIYNTSMEFYGPEGPYNAFAGHDASRNLGKMKVGNEEANADWTKLAPQHAQTLNEWEERLRSKYPAVGWVVDPEGTMIKRAEMFEP